MQSSGRPELFHFISLILMSEYVTFTLSTDENEIEIAHCVSSQGLLAVVEDWKDLGGNLAPNSLFFYLSILYIDDTVLPFGVDNVTTL